LWQGLRSCFIDGALALYREVNPPVAAGALTSKTHIAPPRADERVMNRTTESF
jgi:hypothetical protein